MQGYTNFHRKLARSRFIYATITNSKQQNTQREIERPTERERDRDREREREPRTHNFITKKTDIQIFLTICLECPCSLARTYIFA